MSRARTPSSWSAARIRSALGAVASAILTCLFVMVVDGDGGIDLAVVGYLLSTSIAVFAPAAITVQVIGGQALAALLVLGPAAVEPLLLIPLVGGVIVTAELLAVVARLDSPVDREPEGVGAAVGIAAILGSGVFASVALVGFLPGLTGLIPVAIASAACFGLALRMARGAS